MLSNLVHSDMSWDPMISAHLTWQILPALILKPVLTVSVFTVEKYTEEDALLIDC